MKTPRSSGSSKSFERGLLMGVALAKGEIMTRREIMKRLFCSAASATRYMQDAERLLAARWERGHGGGTRFQKNIGRIWLPRSWLP